MLKYVELKKIFKFGIRKKLLRRGKVEKTIQSFSFKRKLITTILFFLTGSLRYNGPFVVRLFTFFEQITVEFLF